MRGPLPHNSCAKTLSTLITVNFRILRERPELSALLTSNQSGMLSTAVLLQDANDDELNSSTKVLRNYLLTSSSYAKENCRTLMEDLLAVDEHLRTCCQTAFGLATAIELHIPTALAAMTMGYDEGGVETAVSKMIASFYQCHYQRHIYIRLYNFDTACSPFPIHNSGLTLVKLDHSDIAELVGETTYHSNLHDSKTGTCFLRISGTHPVDERDAFNEAWGKAHDLLRVLKYVKCGVIDIDYGAVYYHPSWVTRIRRPGLRFWGQPRRDIQDALYVLADTELPKVTAYVASYERLRAIIEDPKPTSLRLAGSIAGNFYEGHYRRLQRERDHKLIELVIALETLFSPDARVNRDFESRKELPSC